LFPPSDAAAQRGKAKLPPVCFGLGHELSHPLDYGLAHGRGPRVLVDQVERFGNLAAQVLADGNRVVEHLPGKSRVAALVKLHQQPPLEQVHVRNLKQRADVQAAAVAPDDRRSLEWILQEAVAVGIGDVVDQIVQRVA
jgi:hypothetical protein